jgi:hypothetical protein
MRMLAILSGIFCTFHRSPVDRVPQILRDLNAFLPEAAQDLGVLSDCI